MRKKYLRTSRFAAEDKKIPAEAGMLRKRKRGCLAGRSGGRISPHTGQHQRGPSGPKTQRKAWPQIGQRIK